GGAEGHQGAEDERGAAPRAAEGDRPTAARGEQLCRLRRGSGPLLRRRPDAGGEEGTHRVPEDAVTVEHERFDDIVVGSGAGGGPLAANLAVAGHRVLLLEAGGEAGGPVYDVPVFHGFAAEDQEMSWAFFVRHYKDNEQQKRDSKFTAAK